MPHRDLTERRNKLAALSDAQRVQLQQDLRVLGASIAFGKRIGSAVRRMRSPLLALAGLISLFVVRRPRRLLFWLQRLSVARMAARALRVRWPARNR